MKLLNFLLAGTILFACNAPSRESKETAEKETTQMAPEPIEKSAICVWDQVSVRETPSAKGKWVTAISIGESLMKLGETAVDSLDGNRSYIRVRLADGTEGWSVSELIIEDGKVAVFMADKDIYQRPDLLTKVDKKFSQMDIVAVKSEQDDWFEVIGKRAEGKWIESAWVKKGDISQSSIDVAVAKFASKALAMDSEEDMASSLQEIIDNSDLNSSAFIPILREKLPTEEEAIDVEEEMVMEESDSTSMEE